MARRKLIEIEPPESSVIVINVGGPKKVYKKKYIRREYPRRGKYVYEKLEIDWLKLIAEEVKLARIRQHLSQRTLAHQLGTGQSEISHFETGKSNPTAEFINRILTELKLIIEIKVGCDD